MQNKAGTNGIAGTVRTENSEGETRTGDLPPLVPPGWCHQRPGPVRGLPLCEGDPAQRKVLFLGRVGAGGKLQAPNGRPLLGDLAGIARWVINAF